MTLTGLGEYLAERKISPGTVSYMLDHQGRVIAASDLSKTYANVRQARAAAHHRARERPAGLRLQRSPARQRGPLHLRA